MTVKELKIELEKYPDNMEIFVKEKPTDFGYHLLKSVLLKELNFIEDSNENVLILNEH